MSQFETISLNDIPAQENDFSPIPAGEYIVGIKNAELKDTKDGTGQYIKLKLDVIAPTNVGRILFANINIRNKSQVAENIGRQQLGSIMRALGLNSVSDTDMLIGGTLAVKVAIKEAQNGYEASNEVKAYKAVEGSAPPRVLAAHVALGEKDATVTQSAPARATPPWGAKKV